MKLHIIANFKSNKTTAQVNDWISQVDSHPATKLLFLTLAPSFTTFPASPPKNISLAAQNASSFPAGSYTGEINADQLSELSVRYCLIGHSERRRYLHETNQEISNKADLLLESDITPIILLDQEYIVSQLAALSKSVKKNSLFAYEPASEIGGTDTAPLDDISSTVAKIRNLLPKDSQVLYGGSVNTSNINPLLDLDLAGYVISSATLDADNFIKLLKVIASHG